MSDRPILFTTVDQVLRITLNRPAQKNSLTPTLVREIVEALEAVSADDSARVIAIDAHGPDFCTGADLVASNRKLLEDLLYRVRKLELPDDRRG